MDLFPPQSLQTQYKKTGNRQIPHHVHKPNSNKIKSRDQQYHDLQSIILYFSINCLIGNLSHHFRQKFLIILSSFMGGLWTVGYSDRSKRQDLVYIYLRKIPLQSKIHSTYILDSLRKNLIMLQNCLVMLFNRYNRMMSLC